MVDDCTMKYLNIIYQVLQKITNTMKHYKNPADRNLGFMVAFSYILRVFEWLFLRPECSEGWA